MAKYTLIGETQQEKQGAAERIRVLEQNLSVANERYDFWLGFARDLGKTIGWPGDRQMREAIPEIASAWAAAGRSLGPCECGDLCIPDEMSTCRRGERSDTPQTLSRGDTSPVTDAEIERLVRKLIYAQDAASLESQKDGGGQFYELVAERDVARTALLDAIRSRRGSDTSEAERTRPTGMDFDVMKPLSGEGSKSAGLASPSEER